MKNRRVLLLLLIALVGFSGMVYSTPSFAQVVGGDFPIGSEDPFPWDIIEGEWSFDKDTQMKYRFRVLSISDNGTRTVWVQQIDSSNSVLAEGSAFVKRNRRVLHARMQVVDGTKYRLRFAAYQKPNRYGCDQKVYTMQIRQLNSRGEITSNYSNVAYKLTNLK